MTLLASVHTWDRDRAFISDILVSYPDVHVLKDYYMVLFKRNRGRERKFSSYSSQAS